MSDQTMTNALVCTWAVATDAAGRSSLQAQWAAPVAAPTPVIASAA